MNVASRELSRALYKLSGWNETYLNWFEFIGQDFDLYQEAATSNKSNDYRQKDRDFICPAYDLSHLLRELPPQTCIKKEYEASPELPKETPAHYRALYDTVDDRHFWLGASTPEDATCKLAIELFKHGVLKRK